MKQDRYTIFNHENTNHKNGHYELFLDQHLGAGDIQNVTYPQIENLYYRQKQFDWIDNEIDLRTSKMDLVQCPDFTYDLMLKTLSYLTEADSVVSVSVIQILAPFITNPELMDMIVQLSSIESVHKRTYNRIAVETLRDPSQIFDEIYKNEQLLNRGHHIVIAFDNLLQLQAKFILGEIPSDSIVIKEAILKALCALYMLEGIQFMSSFLTIFGLARQGMFTAIADYVTLIARDEQLHIVVVESILNILFTESKIKDQWIQAYKNIEHEIEAMFEEVITQEETWNKYLFTEGRKATGLNETVLNRYTYFRAGRIKDFLNLEYDIPEVKEDPCSWSDVYFDMDKVQTAPQELTLINYKVNSTKEEDIDDFEFDF